MLNAYQSANIKWDVYTSSSLEEGLISDGQKGDDRNGSNQQDNPRGKGCLVRAETNSLQLLIFGISGEVTCKGSNWDQVGWTVQRNRTSLVLTVDVLKQKWSE